MAASLIAAGAKGEIWPVSQCAVTTLWCRGPGKGSSNTDFAIFLTLKHAAWGLRPCYCKSEINLAGVSVQDDFQSQKSVIPFRIHGKQKEQMILRLAQRHTCKITFLKDIKFPQHSRLMDRLFQIIKVSIKVKVDTVFKSTWRETLEGVIFHPPSPLAPRFLVSLSVA